jgi:hypothetical protein
MGVVRYDAETWAAIRRDWCETSLSLAQLMARHGPAGSTIERRAKREGWGARGSSRTHAGSVEGEPTGARFADEETWKEIRRGWEETTEPIVRMAARFKVGYSTICHRAIRQGWAPRPSKASRRIPHPVKKIAKEIAASSGAALTGETLTKLAFEASKKVREKARRALEARGSGSYATRLRRSYRLIDLQIAQLEKLIMSGEDLSPQDQERMTRAIATLVGKIEASGESAGDNGQGSANAAPGSHERNRNIERMRREITERLERLNEEWLAQQKP